MCQSNLKRALSVLKCDSDTTKQNSMKFQQIFLKVYFSNHFDMVSPQTCIWTTGSNLFCCTPSFFPQYYVLTSHQLISRILIKFLPK